MVGIASWRVSLAEAVDEAGSLIASLHDAPHNAEMKGRLARTATLVRSVAQVRGLDTMSRAARTISRLARKPQLDAADMEQLDASMDWLRSLAAAALGD